MYEMSITREHRTAFVILIDQSGSMAEIIDYEGRDLTKAEAVAEVTNQLLSELIERAKQQEGVRDYYDLAVIGYSGDGVKSILPNSEEEDTSNVKFISVEQLSKLNQTTKSRTKEIILPDNRSLTIMTNDNVWVTPKANGTTPMFEGLNIAYRMVKRWCSTPENQDSFPPIIFNITDGESSDCGSKDIEAMSRKIQHLTTTDGGVLYINIHITNSKLHSSIIFPTLEEVKSCPNIKARELGLSSSIMPEIYNELICEIKGVVGEKNFVGVSYNTSIAELITILNIGTISVKRG